MPKDSSNGVDEASAFLDHVQTTYPETADHWQALDSEQDLVDIINGEDYASDGTAGLSFGIVFSSGSPDFEYKVQLLIPLTAVPIGCLLQVLLLQKPWFLFSLTCFPFPNRSYCIRYGMRTKVQVLRLRTDKKVDAHSMTKKSCPTSD